MPDLKHNCHKCNQHIDSSFATNTKIGTTILKSISNLLCMHGEDSNSGTACWPVDCLEVIGSSPAFWASLHMSLKSETSHKTSEVYQQLHTTWRHYKTFKTIQIECGLASYSWLIHAKYPWKRRLQYTRLDHYYYLKIQFNDLKLHKGCPNWVH